jgi:hypothetical protein
MSSWTIKKCDDTLLFETSTLRLSWKHSESGSGLTGMFRTADGAGFSFGDGSPLWSLDVRDKQGFCFPLGGSDFHHFSYEAGDTLCLQWGGLVDGLIDVSLTGTADPDRPLLRWRMHIANRSDSLTIWNIVFPSFSDVLGPTGSHDADMMLTSEGFGCSIPHPQMQRKHAVWERFRYPNNIVSMPYCALKNGNTGLYIGLHDPAGMRKDFQYTPPEGLAGTAGSNDTYAGAQPIRVTIPAPDSGRAQKELSLDFDTVMALFDGDWYDAALLQREWVETLPRTHVSVADNPLIPGWAKTLPLWIRCDVTERNNQCCSEEEYRRHIDILLKFKNIMGCEIGAHLYQWHTDPFDLIYPAYTPRPGLKEFVAELQANGIHAMPYINGRIYDVDCPDWDNDNARRFATKEQGAKFQPKAERIIFETYGSATPLAVMCPATEYWQDKIAAVIERLARDLDVDGVYIDQIGAAWPELCADAAHGHELRNGAWWNEGYYTMLQNVRDRLSDQEKTLLLTTESNADPFTHLLGMLMVNSHRNYIVPAFPAVYGSRAYLFGRSASVASPDAFRIMTYQNVLWGCQPGWFGVDDIRLLMTDEHAGEMAVVQRAAALFSRLQPFVYNGSMCRPPKNEAACKTVDITWKFNGLWPETVDTIWTAAWENAGQKITIVANAHSTEQQAVIPYSSATPDIWWTPGPEGTVSITDGKATITLPPGTAVTLTT